ncbi:MAG TPA: enoyl-CoA hydratase [Deltaproteobacteria bacterium]|nr:enoyl-CoA hydratase [Deltaproteobacteria bacterium]
MTTVRTDPLEEGILRVTLERPERLNAISSGLLADLHATLDRLAVDRETRVVILTGAGRGFCSGADLGQRDGPGAIPGTEGMSPLGFVYRYQESLAEVMLKIHELPQPVIAAVNGVAVGGGLALALASDIRFASTEASFGSAFIKAGLSSCDVGTSYFLPRLIHPGDAAELMLTGRIFDAEEARRLGLLQDLVAPEALQDRALETARLIRNNNEYGVWMTKKGLWTNLDAPSLRHAMEIENRTQVLGCFTGNMEEAMKAFVEKRPPNWKRL